MDEKMRDPSGSRFTRDFGWMCAHVDDGFADVGYRETDVERDSD